MIFTVSQFGVLWDATQETYWVWEKKLQRRELSNKLGLPGKSVLKIYKFPSNLVTMQPVPPTSLHPTLRHTPPFAPLV